MRFALVLYVLFALALPVTHVGADGTCPITVASAPATECHSRNQVVYNGRQLSNRLINHSSLMLSEPEQNALEGLSPSAAPFRSDAILRAAVELQKIGPEKAGAQLSSLAKDKKLGFNAFILCRLLFSETKGGEFRSPNLGSALYLGATEGGDWPLEPIEIIDGIPFLVVSGYKATGVTERPLRYVHYCLGNCEWSETQFKNASQEQKKKALETLLSSQKWKAKLTASETDFLTAQID